MSVLLVAATFDCIEDTVVACTLDFAISPNILAYRMFVCMHVCMHVYRKKSFETNDSEIGNTDLAKPCLKLP